MVYQWYIHQNGLYISPRSMLKLPQVNAKIAVENHGTSQLCR